jgi:hypothetical protein
MTVMYRLGTRQLRHTYPTESVAQSFNGRLTADLWMYSFCYESGTQPFEGFIRPRKKLFFAGFRQLVYFLYERRRG